ncbi:MAG: hypothetical protein IJX28_07320 [Clostridia bacterium]|nr:hypothetical protein [Clostridia bacterium]
METMLQAVVVVFMLFLCSLCLFAVIVIVRDIIHENSKARMAREREEREFYRAQELAAQAAKVEPEAIPVVATPAPAPEPEPEPEPEPAPAPVVEEPAPVEPVAEEPAPAEVDDGAVTFSTHTLTMEEKYAALSTEYKRYFDDIVRHALSKEGVKEAKHNNSHDYKIGSYRVIRMMIKRGEIVCEFNFIDRDILDYANASNVKMKQSASSMKVTEPAGVGAAKDGIDLVCTQIAEDKAYKKELAKEKRKEKRKAAEEEA